MHEPLAPIKLKAHNLYMNNSQETRLKRERERGIHSRFGKEKKIKSIPIDHIKEKKRDLNT